MTKAETIPLDIETYAKDDFLACAYYGETDRVIAALRGGADVNATDERTGLSALHLAVGTNNMPLTKALVEEFKAAFVADGSGRWPSVMAIDCKVSDELSDYIVHAEAKFLGLDT